MTLHILLCYLLYLAAIVSPGAYFQWEIDQKQQENQAAIDQIEQDPVLSNQIVNDYSEQASWIEIFDETGED